MIDLPLAAGLALVLGQLAPSSPWPVAFTAVGLVVLAWRRLSVPRVGLLLLLFAFGSHRASTTLASYDLTRAVARDALGAPETCSGTLRVVASPARRGDRFGFLAEAIALQCEGSARVAPGTLLRLYSPSDDLARGDVWDVVLRAGALEIPRNFELEGGHAYAARLGAALSGGVLDGERVARDHASSATWIDRARAHARRRIDASYPPDAAPMARALVLGESDLPEQDAEAFRLSGLSHLLAVSGTHIVLAVFGLVRLIGALLVRVEWLASRCDVGRVAAGIGVPLAWAYAEFAGAGGSVRRAALMATVVLCARAMARLPDGVRAFGLSLLAGSLIDPLAAFDVSFGLSAGATAGLLIGSRPLAQRLQRLPRPLCWAAAPVSATVSSSAFCLPWLTLLGPRFSLVGVAANVLAVPVGEMVSLPACLAHLLLAPFPTAERGVALLGSGSLLLVRAVARHAAAMEFLAFDTPRPTDWQLAACVLTVAASVLLPKRRPSLIAAGAVALLLLESLTVAAAQPKGRLRITVLDVGQGDSIVVDFPDGRGMLIDGGGVVGSPVDPGLRVVSPVLRARRRNVLSLAVLTHPHPDHVIGLASTVPQVSVGELWDTGQGEREGAGPTYAGLLSGVRGRGIPVRRPSELCGKVFPFGEARMRVLGPCPDIVPGRGGNDNSFVLHLRLGARSALLVGDAEREQESDLLRLGPAMLRADLLKVGHHGSKTSTSTAFLDAVAPRDAVITSGVRNRYGHPTPETLEVLRQRRVRVFRSDRHGAVRWETDGESVWVTTVVGRPPEGS